MSATDRSFSRLEREADYNRDRLSDTLDELRYRLTPGQMTKEVMGYARSNGFSLVRALGDAARANPLPALLIGAGCMLLMSSRASGAAVGGTRRGPSMTSRASRAGSAAASGVSDAASSVGSGVSDAASSAGSAASHAASSVRDTVADAGRRTREAAHDFRDQVSETYESYAEELGERAEAFGDYASEQSRRVGGQLERGWSMMEEQPLIMAAVGVAIGAAIGAALPSTDIEDEYLGETSDRVKGHAADLAQEQYDQARSAVSRTAEKVARDAEAEGLTGQTLRSAAEEVGARVRNVASGAAETLKSEAGMSKSEGGPSRSGMSEREHKAQNAGGRPVRS